LISLDNFYSYFIGFEFSVVTQGWAKIVDKSTLILSSFSVVNPFGHIASQYGYMIVVVWF
jgi:hypothetical protein